MFNVGSLIIISRNGLTQSCKIVQSIRGEIEVEYVNCPDKPAFWLDESSPIIVTPKYMLRSATHALPMNTQESISIQSSQLPDPTPNPINSTKVLMNEFEI